MPRSMELYPINLPQAICKVLFHALPILVGSEDETDASAQRKITYKENENRRVLRKIKHYNQAQRGEIPLILRCAETPHRDLILEGIIQELKKKEAQLEANRHNLAPQDKEDLEDKIASLKELCKAWKKTLEHYTVKIVPTLNQKNKQLLTANSCSGAQQRNPKASPSVQIIKETEQAPYDSNDPMNQLYTNEPYASYPYQNKQAAEKPKKQPPLIEILSRL